MMKIRVRQRGISLIEVLVVMVLLLIGIFSIVRLFPPGFLITRQTESQTLGARLARQEMDRWNTLVANVPDHIVAVRPVPIAGPPGYVFLVDTDTVMDDLSPGRPNNMGVDPFYYADINKFRRILGESVRIPIPSPVALGPNTPRGSVYVVSAGPIYHFDPVAISGCPPSPSIPQTVFVRGAPLFRRVSDISDDDIALNLGVQQYAIDYDAGQVAFTRSTTQRRYVATYSFIDANNRAQTIVDEEIIVPANTAVWVALQGNGGRPLVPDSDLVSRGFADRTADWRCAPASFAWSTTDPYEFLVLSPNEGSFANIGVLVFNPLGRDYTENTPAGPQPLTARIDFDVLDWHIIREDRPMPAAAPFTVKLALKNLKVLNYPEADGTKYAGLFRDSTIPPANRVDILVYDLSTGNRIAPANYTVDYRNGAITFTDAFGNANANGNFRVFYKGRGDWALSIHKASSLYRRRLPAGGNDHEANISFAQYYLGNGAVGRATRMYFCPIDAGKSVAIRELWYDDNTGAPVKVTNESYRINADRGRFETLDVPGVGPRVFTWIDLKEKHADAVVWNPAQTGQAATGVQGVSFRTRVIYNNGTVYRQTPVGVVNSTRWSRIDLDNFLTRGQ